MLSERVSPWYLSTRPVNMMEGLQLGPMPALYITKGGGDGVDICMVSAGSGRGSSDKGPCLSHRWHWEERGAAPSIGTLRVRPCTIGVTTTLLSWYLLLRSRHRNGVQVVNKGQWEGGSELVSPLAAPRWRQGQRNGWRGRSCQGVRCQNFHRNFGYPLRRFGGKIKKRIGWRRLCL